LLAYHIATAVRKDARSEKDDDDEEEEGGPPLNNLT
jgi:hypothetical protein